MILSYAIGGDIFIQFDKLIKQGNITLTNKQHKPVSSRTFTNTNFTKISNNNLKGKVYLEIECDGEHITKPLNIL